MLQLQQVRMALQQQKQPALEMQGRLLLGPAAEAHQQP
jgi:hypothetical protein